MNSANGRDPSALQLPLPQPQLRTARLSLVPLTPAQLRLCLANRPLLEKSLAMPISGGLISASIGRAIRHKLYRGRDVPAADWLWLTYWLIVINREQYGAGLAGFKGSPDEQGDVEIGYGIDPVKRGHGYMTEAVQALLAWAFTMDACRSVSADTLKSNPASRRVLEKVGMSVYRETPEMLYFRLDKPARQE